MTAALDQTIHQAYQQLLARQAPAPAGAPAVVDYQTLTEQQGVVPGVTPDTLEWNYHQYNTDMEDGLTEAEFRDMYINQAFQTGMDQVTTAYATHQEAQGKVDQIHEDLAVMYADMSGKMTAEEWAAYEAQYKADHGYEALVAEVDAKALELAAVLEENQEVFLTGLGTPTVPLAGPAYDMLMGAYGVVANSSDPTVALNFGAAMMDPANHTPSWQPSAQEVFDDVLGPAVSGLIAQRAGALAVDGEPATPEELDGIFQEVEGWLGGIDDKLRADGEAGDRLKDFEKIYEQVKQLRHVVTAPDLGGTEGAIAAAGKLSQFDKLGGAFSALGVTMLGLRLGQDGLSGDTAKRMADAAGATEDLLTVGATVLKAAGRHWATLGRAGTFLSARLPVVSLVVGATQAISNWKDGNKLAAVGAIVTTAGVFLGPQVMLLGLGITIAAALFGGDDELDPRVQAARESYASTLTAKYQQPPYSLSAEDAEARAWAFLNTSAEEIAYLQETGVTTEQMQQLMGAGIPLFDGNSEQYYHDLFQQAFRRPDGSVDTQAATDYLLGVSKTVSSENMIVAAAAVVLTLQHLEQQPLVETDAAPGTREWQQVQITAYLAANPDLETFDPDGYRALQALIA